MKEFTIIYNEKNDNYELLIRNNKNEDFSYSLGWKCTGNNEEFIHFSIIEQLNHHILLGYKYVYYKY